jgi:type I restriction enzyme S subunit
MPDNKTLVKFDSLAKSIINQIRLNNQQSQTLITLRDILLPKLMNGEILD